MPSKRSKSRVLKLPGRLTALVRLASVFFATVVLLLVVSLRVVIFKQLLSSTNSTSRRGDSCYFIGHDPLSGHVVQFNTRSFCLTSSVCFPAADPSASYFHLPDSPAPTCTVTAPDFSPIPIPSALITREFQSCANLQRRAVLCAHGPGLSNDSSVCPRFAPLSPDQRISTRWYEDISIVVPSYPFPGNIFHYASVPAILGYIVDLIPLLGAGWGPDTDRTKVNLIFRAPPVILARQDWQRQLMSLIIHHRMKKTGVSIAVHHLKPETSVSHVCVRNAIVLGSRGHLNLWPFPNSTTVPLDGSAVPVDAIHFKRAVYRAFDIRSRLPSTQKPISELPPLAVGYARRDAPRDPPPGKFLKHFDARRFSDADEAWLMAVLRNETSAVGAELRVFTVMGNETLREQVTNVVRVGFMVGIHGANLVNSIFMHPFGALLEILPAGMNEECYIAGMNSGLAYFRHESSQLASPEESRCRVTDDACRNELRQRVVKISARKDRDRVRELVRAGLSHLRLLHGAYPDGIPVAHNKETAFYDIKQPER